MYIKSGWIVCNGIKLANRQSAKPVWHIPIAVYSVLDSGWWTENLSETCRILFQK